MGAWVYPRVDSHWHILDKGDGDKRIYAEGINLTLNGRIRYAGTHAYSESISNTMMLNTWQHVALTWSTSEDTTRLYHNGAEVGYAIRDAGTGGVLDDTTQSYTIGARGALGATTFFDGIIDEVRLYNRALSRQEVGQLYYYVLSCPTNDLNADCKIGFDDLLIFSGKWLWTGLAGSILQDIIEDGAANFADFAKLTECWLDTWNRPPEVNITQPEDGAQFYSNQIVDIEVDAWDTDGSVAEVEFSADRNIIEEDNDGTDGWKTSCRFSVGSYGLTAKAIDDKGAATISTAVQIKVFVPPR